MIPTHIQKAVSSKNRPASDQERDSLRKPGEVLRFFDVKEGDKIGELNAGRGYFSSIAAHAVGENGMVIAHTSPMSVKRWKGNPIEKRLEEFPQSNLIPVVGDMESPNFPGHLDKIFNIMTYHDAVWTGVDRDRMNTSIFNTLRDAGIYGILDHHARPGQGKDDCQEIHRIEKEFVIDEILRAGFILEKESNLFENPEDDLTSMVFEKGIRDQTSRFLLCFKKS